MREYGKIFTRFWTSPDITGLAWEPKCLAAYLLSSQHTNMIGCFRLPFEYVASDLNCTREIVAVHFKELERVEFCRYDGQTCWVLMPNFLKWNPLENWNMGKAAAKLITQVPRRSPLYPALTQALRDHGAAFLPKGFLDGLETVTVTVAKPLQAPAKFPKDDATAIMRASIEDADNNPPPVLIPPPAPVPCAIALLCNAGPEFQVTEAQVAEFQQLYPAVDVLQQLREMRAWTISNPKQRKTHGGMMRFINQWLSKEQDKPAPARAGSGAYTQAPAPAPAPVSAPKPTPVHLPADLNRTTGPRAWQAIAELVRKRMDAHSFQTWIQPLKGIGISKGTLYVQLPMFDFEIVQEKWGEQINAAAESVGLSAVKFIVI